MNKRTRLIASLLFIVLIVFAGAVTRFYVSVPENMHNDDGQTEIVRTVETDSDGNVIFSNGAGSFGIARDGKITAVPEWHDLKFAGNNICIASKKFGGKILYGCTDYEGNIVIPFVYKSIEKHVTDEFTVYCAECSSNGSFVLYDGDFRLLLRQPWDSCEFSESEITVTDNAGIYNFSAGSYGLIFKSAVVSGEVMNFPYSLNVSSRVLLSKLTVSMIEKMVSGAEKYIEYAYTCDDELLSEFEPANRKYFIPAFRDDPRIISRKLLGISEVHIYSVSSDDGIPKYDISVNVDTEIVYYDESGEKRSLNDNYRLAVKFSGSSESDFYAVSGNFELDSPEYPEPVQTDETEQETGI